MGCIIMFVIWAICAWIGMSLLGGLGLILGTIVAFVIIADLNSR